MFRLGSFSPKLVAGTHLNPEMTRLIVATISRIKLVLEGHDHSTLKLPIYFKRRTNDYPL